MKNYFFIFMLVILNSCSEENTSVIEESSKESSSIFARNSSQEIDELKNHLLQNSIFKKYDNVNNLLFENLEVVKEGGVDVFVIPSRKNDEITGVLFAFKLNENLSKQFPNSNNKYALLYHNVDNYNLNTKTGEILSYDLNYDKMFMIRDFDNGSLTNFESFPVLGNITHGSIENDCRGGSNGNLSWGECYSCLRGACNSNSNCRGMTDMVDYLSTRFGLAGIAFSSFTSMGAACVVISSIY